VGRNPGTAHSAPDNNGTFKPVVPWYPTLENYVDEAFKASTGPNGLHLPSPRRRLAHRPTSHVVPLQAAREFAPPGVKLFYNDYGAEGDLNFSGVDRGAWAWIVNLTHAMFFCAPFPLGLNSKSDRVYNMVQSMKQRGIPIDGVGRLTAPVPAVFFFSTPMWALPLALSAAASAPHLQPTFLPRKGLQMHIVVDAHPSFDDIENNIRRLGALGLEVHITEMDVRCTNCTAVSSRLSDAFVLNFFFLHRRLLFLFFAALPR
jgi:hypothetical protein